MASSYNHDIYDYIIGDYNNDGYITADDAQDCLIISTELNSYNYPPFPVSGSSVFEASPQQVFCCDVDGDGEITATDAQRIIQYYTDTQVANTEIHFDDTIRPVDNIQGLIYYGYLSNGGFYYDSSLQYSMVSRDKCYYYDLTEGQNKQLYYCNKKDSSMFEFIKIPYPISVTWLRLGYVGTYQGNVAFFIDEALTERIENPENGKYYLDRNNNGLWIFVVPTVGHSGMYCKVG